MIAVAITSVVLSACVLILFMWLRHAELARLERDSDAELQRRLLEQVECSSTSAHDAKRTPRSVVDAVTGVNTNGE